MPELYSQAPNQISETSRFRQQLGNDPKRLRELAYLVLLRSSERGSKQARRFHRLAKVDHMPHNQRNKRYDYRFGEIRKCVAIPMEEPACKTGHQRYGTWTRRLSSKFPAQSIEQVFCGLMTFFNSISQSHAGIDRKRCQPSWAIWNQSDFRQIHGNRETDFNPQTFVRS